MLLPEDSGGQNEKTYIPLDEDEVAIFLADGGPMSALYENFEERPVQIALMRQIARAFNKNAIGVFEAGTGVGKSYAYLIPSIVWALENRNALSFRRER